MAACTLRIGDRVALASVGGAPEVEYVLFDPGAIELAAMGPGMVQEVGYVTTADEAITRLNEAGISWSFVLETAAAMHPTIAMAYARGPAIRGIATSLGSAELFEGFRYDAKAKAYEGRWLDLPALMADAAVPQLTHILQAMHLLAVLLEAGPDDPVHLLTRDHMANARPGGRSYKRYNFPATSELPATLRTFAERLRSSPPADRVDPGPGPTSAELLDALRERIVLLPEGPEQDRLRAIEKAIGIRERPMRGPLADPEIWALEEQLSAGRTQGVVELIDALEKAKGKQPATGYLRVRAALMAGRDPPRALAERIGSLALAMPSFVELELLAVEAWNAAGDLKRALPFARDLIQNSSVNDELRIRESQSMVGQRPSQIPDAGEAPPSARPTTPATPELSAGGGGPMHAAAATDPLESESGRRPTQPGLDGDRTTPVPLKPRPSVVPQAPTSRPVAASSRKETPPMVFGAPEPPPKLVPSVPTTRNEGLLAKRRISGTWVGPPPSKSQAGHPTEMNFGAVPPPTSADAGRPAPPSSRASRVPPPVSGAGVSVTSRTPPPPASIPAGSVPPASGPTASVPPTAAGRTTSRPSADVPRLANWSATELMRGASQPPFRSDSPDAHVHVPKAPPIPHLDSGAEAATALTLPEGLRGVPDPIEALPRTVLDARLQFTFLSRELGREYDEQLGITLRADISGIEAMQRVLLERYGQRAVTTAEAAADVRRHGAFLSEILARTFGAFWVDIGPNDVGYWAMVVPPGTRVWPFGRILRLIAMQHNERDLVSYFLELQGRGARG